MSTDLEQMGLGEYQSAVCLATGPGATSITSLFFFFNDTATTEIYTLSLHDALPISDFDLLINNIYAGRQTKYLNASEKFVLNIGRIGIGNFSDDLSLLMVLEPFFVVTFVFDSSKDDFRHLHWN